jgi:HEAT repeat protein
MAAPTHDEVRLEIDKDEPDYPELAAKLGEESLPALEALVAEDDPRIASKAAYLAGVIAGPGSEGIVDLAARSRHHVIRVAAAAALPSLPGPVTDTAERLLADPDVGVRARAVKSAAALGDPQLADRVRSMAEQDEAGAVREVAQDAADRMSPG